MKYNATELAERYHITETEVETKISEWKKQAKAVISKDYTGDDLDGYVESFLTSSKISAIFMPSGYEYAELQIQQANPDFVKYNAVLLGVSQTADLNDYNKRTITGEWWNGSEEKRKSMENEGIIAVRISKNGNNYPVALDNRPTFENGNENPNYGNELPYKASRNIPALINGTIVIARGDLASPKSKKTNIPRIGCKSTVIGHVVNDVYKIYKDAYVDEGKFEQAYETVLPAVLKSEHYISLDQMDTLPEDKFVPFVSIGEVWRVSEIERDKYGKPVISVTFGNEQMTKGIKMKARYQPTINDADALIDSQEVIIAGERRYMTDKETGNKIYYYQLWGVIAKPDDARAKAIAALDALGI